MLTDSAHHCFQACPTTVHLLLRTGVNCFCLGGFLCALMIAEAVEHFPLELLWGHFFSNAETLPSLFISASALYLHLWKPTISFKIVFEQQEDASERKQSERERCTVSYQ